MGGVGDDLHTISVDNAEQHHHARQWMYPREANVRLTGLVRSGLLDLSQFEATEFALDDANKAVRMQRLTAVRSS